MHTLKNQKLKRVRVRLIGPKSGLFSKRSYNLLPPQYSSTPLHHLPLLLLPPLIRLFRLLPPHLLPRLLPRLLPPQLFPFLPRRHRLSLRQALAVVVKGTSIA